MIDIYDSDIVKIDEGPMKWMVSKQGTGMSLESFRRGAVEQFAEVGFRANVKTYETTEAGTYAFEVEILGRVDPKFVFDNDQMIHEVTRNVLDDPDQETGFIKSPMGTEAAAARQKHKH
jgi:hypothetical protein